MTTAPVLRRLAMCAAAGMLSACAPQSPQTNPNGGTITVGVTTTGPGLKGLTFQLKFDDDVVVKTVNADAGVVSIPIGAGDHRLTLEVPDRCTVEGGPERTVKVVASGVTPLRYSVTCK